MNYIVQSMVSLDSKDYSFLKELLEAEQHQLTTREIRRRTEQHSGQKHHSDVEPLDDESGIVPLNNSQINYRKDSWGDGNKNVSGKGFVTVERLSSDDGNAPKTIKIVEERLGELNDLLSQYNPSLDNDDFSSAQEALNYVFERVEETKSQADANAHNLESVEEAMETIKDELSGLQAENKKLQSQVEEYDEMMNVFNKRHRPLVIAMAEELEEKMGFNPSEHIEE